MILSSNIEFFTKIYKEVIEEARKALESTILPEGLTIIKLKRDTPSRCGVFPDLYF